MADVNGDLLEALKLATSELNRIRAADGARESNLVGGSRHLGVLLCPPRPSESVTALRLNNNPLDFRASVKKS